LQIVRPHKVPGTENKWHEPKRVPRDAIVAHDSQPGSAPEADVSGETAVVYVTGVFRKLLFSWDRLCGLVVRVLGYRSEGPCSIPGTTRKKNVVGLERGPLSLVSTTEELLDRKVAAPV
jgi:hypothetical protein